MPRVRYEKNVYARDWEDLFDHYATNKEPPVEELPCECFGQYFVEQRGDKLLLLRERVSFNLVNGVAVWTDLEPKMVWSYNFTMQEFGDLSFDGYKLHRDEKGVYLENIKDKNSVDYYHRDQELQYLIGFLMKIFKVQSPFFHTKMVMNECSLACEVLVINNLIKLTDPAMAETAEKVISSMSKTIFIRQLTDGELVLNTGRKIRQVLQLPDRVLKFINDLRLRGNLIRDFQTICSEDQNDGIYLVDYFESLESVKTFRKFVINDESDTVTTFIKELAEVKELLEKADNLKNFDIPKLLRYLIKQRIYSYYNQFENIAVWGKRRTNMTTLLYPPTSELREYRDYIRMMFNANGNHIIFDLFPKNLQAAHSIAARNVNILKDEDLKEKYEDVVSDWGKYEFSKGDYIVTYPKTLKDLVFEGNYLNHCVASYAKDIAGRKTKVFFIRKSDAPDVPFVTMELNNEGNIAQLKEDCDMDVADTKVINFANAWRKEKVSV